MGTRENAADQDFSGIPLEEEEESHLKDAAVISMGTEISAEDMMNIEALCDQVPPFELYQRRQPTFCAISESCCVTEFLSS